MHNWAPGDYFYHPDYGYQKVGQVYGGFLHFWGPGTQRFIGRDGKVERIVTGPACERRVPISEAVAATEKEALLAACREATASNKKTLESCKPEIEREPIPPEHQQSLKDVLAKIVARKKEKEKAIAATEPAVVPAEAEPAVVSAEAEPAVVSAEAEPAVVPAEAEPTVVPAKAEPAVVSAEAEPAVKKIVRPTPRQRIATELERLDQLYNTRLCLQDMGLPEIPVAPIVRGRDFNSKNPSWLDCKGEPHKLKWRRYAQGATMSLVDKAKFWANPDNGIGTFAGINNIYWIDIDRKHFDSDKACKDLAMKLWEKLGSYGWLEKTQSGGWRMAFKYHGTPFRTFTFSLEGEGQPVGEILGISKDGVGQFVVLAPSYGQLGDYEAITRTKDIPVVDSISEFFGIVKKYKRNHSATYDNPDFVRFPAKLYSFFGKPMALWLLARARDTSGCGRAVLPLDEIMTLTGRSVSSIRRWTTKGVKKGLFAARGFTSADGQGFIEIFYASKERACLLAGTDLGPVGLINIKEDLEALHIHATDILALGIQRQSRHAQYREQVKKVSQKLGVDEEIGKKKAVKPIQPEKLGKSSGHPCENDMARVLWSDDSFLLVSEGFPAYGASLASVSRERGLSLKQTNRHLLTKYREVPSPTRGFREDIKPIEKRQIIQRLARSDMNDRRYEALKFEASEDGLDQTGKFTKDKAGRWWERKCCVIVPHFRLVSCRFRRWRLSKIASGQIAA